MTNHYFDVVEEDILLGKVSRDLGADSREVRELAYVIFSTSGFNRCGRVYFEFGGGMQCVHLPNHKGQCKVITRSGRIKPVRGLVPTPSLLKLSKYLYG